MKDDKRIEMRIIFEIYKLTHKISKIALYNLPFSHRFKAMITKLLCRLFPPPYRAIESVMPCPISFSNFCLFYRKEDEGDLGIIMPLLRGEFYESEVVHEFKRIIKPGMTFVDGGAHIGYFSIIAGKEISKKGKVFAFEPYKPTFEVLKRNIIMNNLEETIIPINMAIADKKKMLNFTIPPNNSVSVKIDSEDSERHVSNERENELLSINAVSLDEYFYPLGFPKIALVKLDIEGAEKMALIGMEEVLKRNPNLKLIIEFNLNNLKRLNNNPKNFLELLLKLGFGKNYILGGKKIRIDLLKDCSKLINLAMVKNLNLLCEKNDAS